jgi:hypothetical protein
LKLQPADRAVLRSLTDEEREAVLDEMLVQVREDLEWVMARAVAQEEQPAKWSTPARRPPPLRTHARVARR